MSARSCTSTTVPLWGIVTRDDLAHSSAELAGLLSGARCAACHTTHHLRQSAGETLLCAACAERASATHWFEEGGETSRRTP